MKDEVKLIPIERIRILNPRPRERRRFEQIVQSIRNLGLKKPIQVSLRSAEEGNEPGYDLVCGQGRIEAIRDDTSIGGPCGPAVSRHPHVNRVGSRPVGYITPGDVHDRTIGRIDGD